MIRQWRINRLLVQREGLLEMQKVHASCGQISPGLSRRLGEVVEKLRQLGEVVK